MKSFLLIFALFTSLISEARVIGSKDQELCSYMAKFKKIYIYKNFDSRTGEYNFTNEIRVLFTSHVDQKKYSADIGWVHDISRVSQNVGVKSATNYNFYDDNGVLLQNDDGKIFLTIKVEEEDFAFLPNQSVGKIEYFFYAEEVFHYTYPIEEERMKTFSGDGFRVDFYLIKKCESY